MSDWWKGAVIYQIYPRSFMDSNNDGVGDLNGITAKLGYVASLGVDAIWISPFFKSPMRDFGYDIADYRAVDPIFGTLDDFKRLLARAHELNLKVIIDQVISHSSDQHAWFTESRQDKTNPKCDWYVWADPKDDGSAPNNWLSFFGGSAWTFEPKRGQYYLHNFLTSQPDINFHNPQVREAQLDNLRFWLDLGVDGFRLDVVNFYYHNASLEDNPTLVDTRTTVGVADINPYSEQQHINDISQPENLAFLTELRALMDSYDARTTIGEINGENALDLMSSYTAGDNRLHMAYTFDLLGKDSDMDHIRAIIERLEASMDQGWPCWALGNHDVTRLQTRWGADKDPIAFPLVATAMLISLHGSICLYQGEELGLPEADVAYEHIVDPYGKPFWPEYKGRDGCRTPIPWTSEVNGGFSEHAPWLPADPKHLALNAASQEAAPHSLLHATRNLLAWRKTVPALVRGSMRMMHVEGVLCWVREYEGQKVFAAFNLTAQTQTAEVSLAIETVLEGHGFDGQYAQNALVLPPYQAFFATLA